MPQSIGVSKARNKDQKSSAEKNQVDKDQRLIDSRNGLRARELAQTRAASTASSTSPRRTILLR